MRILCRLGIHKWKTGLEIVNDAGKTVFDKCIPVTKCERCGKLHPLSGKALMRYHNMIAGGGYRAVTDDLPVGATKREVSVGEECSSN